jgi:hypothetical protein
MKRPEFISRRSRASPATAVVVDTPLPFLVGAPVQQPATPEFYRFAEDPRAWTAGETNLAGHRGRLTREFVGRLVRMFLVEALLLACGALLYAVWFTCYSMADAVGMLLLVAAPQLVRLACIARICVPAIARAVCCCCLSSAPYRGGGSGGGGSEPDLPLFRAYGVAGMQPQWFRRHALLQCVPQLRAWVHASFAASLALGLFGLVAAPTLLVVLIVDGDVLYSGGPPALGDDGGQRDGTCGALSIPVCAAMIAYLFVTAAEAALAPNWLYVRGIRRPFDTVLAEIARG